MSEIEELQAALRVVRGNPTPEELAAVVAILEQMRVEEQSHGVRVAKTAHSTWARNASSLRGEIAPGPMQWQAAFRRGL